MNLVAIKMLVGDKLKYLSLVAGLAFAALLVTQQAAIFTGFALQTGAWIRDTSVADLWVMDEQVEFTEDIKPMLDTAISRVRGVDGVEWAVPMFKSFVGVTLPDGTRRNIRLIGLDDATLTGGPPEMVQGRLSDLKQDKAVILDANATTQLKFKRADDGRSLSVGDRLSINDNEAVVVGSFKASKEFFWEPVLYTTYSRATFWAPDTRRKLQYMLVKVRPGEDVQAVAGRIQATTGLKAMTGEQFEAQTMEWILRETGILVNFGITIALGFIIGVLASGQTLYQFMVENLRHFGAIKAMGAGNGTILRMVLLQVLLVGCVGYGIGLGVACLAGLFLGRGGLAFHMTWQIPVLGAAAILLCCGVSAVVSLIRVIKLEPAVVFKG
jgi:putative ABC transport system permease protein